ncbi:MAG: response regulator [Acidobacteria bacterium]|nr:response regulator [Acidobacteriota bacterium]
MKPIHVVVADSSPSVCRLIKSYLESVPDIRVTGLAYGGQQIIDLVERQQPDVVTMGLEMPDMNGITALKIIQQIRVTPTIVISGSNLQAAAMTVEALQHGAVDFVFKFTPGSKAEPDAIRHQIIAKVRVAAHLTPATGNLTQQIARGVLLPDQKGHQQTSQIDIDGTPAFIPQPGRVEKTPDKVIVAGASTGGPVALRRMLSQLPVDFSGSILVVQHLPPSFTSVLAEQLNEQLLLQVKEANLGSPLEKGTVFITPGQYHLQVGTDGCFRFLATEEFDDHCPSINHTMKSVAEVYRAKARGILLTGTGNDGIEGLAAIRQHGGTTFVQAIDTCTAKGMPQRAIEAGVADHIAPPEKIAQMLMMGY